MKKKKLKSIAKDLKDRRITVKMIRGKRPCYDPVTGVSNEMLGWVQVNEGYLSEDYDETILNFIRHPLVPSKDKVWLLASTSIIGYDLYWYWLNRGMTDSLRCNITKLRILEEIILKVYDYQERKKRKKVRATYPSSSVVPINGCVEVPAIDPRLYVEGINYTPSEAEIRASIKKGIKDIRDLTIAVEFLEKSLKTNN